MKRGQSYLAASLLKDQKPDSDVITDFNAVHSVGVFAQITGVFARRGREGKEGLTVVLYPHRRAKITDLVKAPLPISTGNSDSTTGEIPNPPPLAPIQERMAFLHTHGISIVNITNLKTAPLLPRRPTHPRIHLEIVSVFNDIAQLNPLFRGQITNFSINQVAANVFDEPDKLANFAAAVLTGGVQTRKVSPERSSRSGYMPPSFSSISPGSNPYVTLSSIDTGIHSTHPLLGGKFGPGNKVIGGYEFVGDRCDGKCLLFVKSSSSNYRD